MSIDTTLRVTEIQRFCMHDGPGVRTVVFFKGCPLRCAWCHNPETPRATPEMLFYESKCIYCGKCIEVCPEHHIIENGKNYLLMSKITGKMSCEDEFMKMIEDRPVSKNPKYDLLIKDQKFNRLMRDVQYFFGEDSFK